MRDFRQGLVYTPSPCQPGSIAFTLSTTVCRNNKGVGVHKTWMCNMHVLICVRVIYFLGDIIGR